MKFLKGFIISAILFATSCGGNEQKVPADDASHDDIIAMAQVAANRIAACDQNDTLAMQTAVMDARAERSAFAIAGRKDATETYDKALHDKLQELNPQLCNTIFAKQQ